MFRRFHSAAAVASASVLAQRNILSFPALSMESTKNKAPAPITQPPMSTRVSRMAQLYFSLSDTERENLRRAVMFLGQRRASEVVRTAFLKMRVAAAQQNKLSISKTSSQAPVKPSVKPAPATIAKGKSASATKKKPEARSPKRPTTVASKAPSSQSTTPAPAAKVPAVVSPATKSTNKGDVGSTTPAAMAPSPVKPGVPEAVLRQILNAAPKRASRAKPTVSVPSSTTASALAPKAPRTESTKTTTPATTPNLPPGLLDSLF